MYIVYSDCISFSSFRTDCTIHRQVALCGSFRLRHLTIWMEEAGSFLKPPFRPGEIFVKKNRFFEDKKNLEKALGRKMKVIRPFERPRVVPAEPPGLAMSSSASQTAAVAASWCPSAGQTSLRHGCKKSQSLICTRVCPTPHTHDPRDHRVMFHSTQRSPCRPRRRGARWDGQRSAVEM